MKKKVFVVMIGMAILLMLSTTAMAGGRTVIFSVLENDMALLRVEALGLSNVNGDVIDPQEGDWIALHSHYLNVTRGECNDVLAWGQVDEYGWVEFKYRNPFHTIEQRPKNYHWDRHWFSKYDQCVAPPEWWLFIPEDGNPYYRLDCQGQPGIEAIYARNNIWVVPVDWPCDPWVEICQEY